MRRIWLHNIGLFEIVPNSGKGSCLFKALSQALTLSQQNHNEIRNIVVEHMTCKKWDEKLNDMPDFWKRKIVMHWLDKQRSTLIQSKRSNRTSNIFTKVLHQCLFKWYWKFVERKVNRKYIRIKGLLQRKSYPSSRQMEDFKYVFRKFMSQVNEPGTRFELEAAGNKFRFHFDYLQTIPITNKNHQTQINLKNCTDDDDSCNDIQNNEENLKEIFCAGDKNKMARNETSDVPVKMSMYQFHSCRTCGCKLPRISPTVEHFYFLYSPLTNESTSQINSAGSGSLSFMESGEYWHWELLLPIFLRREPVPLNRRIFGLSYEITESCRNFTDNRLGQTREIPDTVASAIEAFVRKNPEIIPSENHAWPADDGDDYAGCAKVLKNLVYDNMEDEEEYCSSSRRLVQNRENIIQEIDGNNNMHTVF